jgi:exopolysaccharide biosynthesis protein
MTLREAARLMRSLGARNALNLDGGGSSTMTVRGQVVNRPSDPAGERRVSDGLFAMP